MLFRDAQRVQKQTAAASPLMSWEEENAALRFQSNIAFSNKGGFEHLEKHALMQKFIDFLVSSFKRHILWKQGLNELGA